MNDIIKISYDDTSYVVTITHSRGQTSEIGFGCKDTSMAEHAQNLYELAVAMNCSSLEYDVELERQ